MPGPYILVCALAAVQLTAGCISGLHEEPGPVRIRQTETSNLANGSTVRHTADSTKKHMAVFVDH